MKKTDSTIHFSDKTAAQSVSKFYTKSVHTWAILYIKTYIRKDKLKDLLSILL